VYWEVLAFLSIFDYSSVGLFFLGNSCVLKENCDKIVIVWIAESAFLMGKNIEI